MEKEQNYFVINKYSNYWEGNSDNKFNYIYDNQEFISLEPNYSYRAKKTIEINLETIDDEIRNFSDNATSKSVDEKYFFCFDGYHFLYILEKNTKKIRRINIDLYKNDKSQNQEFQKKSLLQDTFIDAIYDEYIIDCKYLENPQMLFVGNTKIYVLDNTKIYVLSKLPNFQIISILHFIKKVQFFTISNNEQILFFSYLNEKNRLYKRNLKFEEYQQIEQDGKNENNISMIIDIDYKINPEHAATRDHTSNNFIDVIINNKLNHLIGLTTSAILIYDFKGYFISKWEFQQIKANLNYFNPTCITIDEQEDEIFVGNGNNGESAFTIKIKYGIIRSIDQKIDPNNANKRLESSNKDEYRFNYEFLKYNGRSSRIFHSRIKNKCCSKNNQNARIIIANIISKEEAIQNKNHDFCKDDNFVDNIKNTPRIQYINTPDKCEDWNSPTDILKIMILDRVQVFDTEKKIETGTKFLDALKEQTKWDKIRVDQEIYPSTTISIYYYCSDRNNEPTENDWVAGPQNANVISLLDCRGRYLKIKITLSTSDEKAFPKLKKLSVYFSPSSYLKYLPSIYQENEQSRDFLERFLAIFQNFYEETDIKLSSFTKFLDPYAIPDGFLPWLSSWLAISTEKGGEWSVENQRLFLKFAPQIFKKRGTKEGLEEIISIYLNNEDNHQKNQAENKEDVINIENKNNTRFFYIIETKLRMRNLKNKEISENTENNNRQDSVNTIKEEPYDFYVLLNPLFVNEKDIQNIKKIVEIEKPAHTVGIVCKLPSLCILGNNSYLGVNTVIQNKGKLRLGISHLGLNSLLGSYGKEGKLGIQSRLGVDSILG